MNKEKIIDIGKVVVVVLMFLTIFYMLATMPISEPRNYEVHSVDGTVYHTTNIERSHQTNRIWFRDENGNSIELGGGYTIIEK